jgi:hypothetical protein
LMRENGLLIFQGGQLIIAPSSTTTSLYGCCGDYTCACSTPC